MKTLHRILFLLFIVFLAASCSTTRTMTAKRMDIYGSGVIQHPVVADLEVSDVKVTATARSSSQNMSVRDVRNNAIANALKQANADVLIEPVFETENRQGVTHVTVTGFPGRYTGFRQATIDDVPLLDMGILQKATVAEPQEEERKNRTGIILGTLGGLGLVILLLTLAG